MVEMIVSKVPERYTLSSLDSVVERSNTLVDEHPLRRHKKPKQTFVKESVCYGSF